MDNNTNKEFIERLNEEIESLIIILQAKDPAEEDYKTINDNLKTLLEVKEVYQKERLRETEIEAKQSEAEMKKKLIEAEIKAKLLEVNQQNEDIPFWKKIDPNVVIRGAVGIGAVVLILKHEKLEVIASKAFGLIPRLLC